MRDGVLDELEYQRVKKEMNKKSDYYSIKEISEIFYRKGGFYNIKFIANNNSENLTHF